MTTFPGETQLYLFSPFCQLHVSLPRSQTWPHYCPSADGWEPQKPQLENSQSLGKNIGFLLSPFGVPTERDEQKKRSVLSDFLTCLKGHDFRGGLWKLECLCVVSMQTGSIPQNLMVLFAWTAGLLLPWECTARF